MFAAQAGARHVYGIECSEIIVQARQIIAENGYSDKITLIHGKVEEIELPVPQVDIILSEWMGYFLLYESMLQTVIFARDKWLNKETGQLYPSSATLSIAACNDTEYRRSKINYWNSVYGFKMTCIRELALQEPLVDTVRPSQLLSTPVDFFSFNLNTVTAADVSELNCDFSLTTSEFGLVDSLVSWFTVHFPGQITLTTSPYFKSTHWQQLIFYLHDSNSIQARRGQVLDGKIRTTLSSGNHRDMDIVLEFNNARQAFKLR